MKQEQFSDALNYLDEDILEETNHVRNRRVKPGKFYLRWVAAAACLVLVFFAGLQLIPWNKQENLPGNIQGNLPMLTVSEKYLSADGFEGLLAYDISEIANANPWKENADLTVMPVYKNQLQFDENFNISNSNPEKMRTLLKETAEKLGMDTESLSFIEEQPNGINPGQMIVQGEDFRIAVDGKLMVSIYFEKPVSLPEQYKVDPSASYEDLESAAEYLKAAYKDLLAMKDPQISIEGGDYDIYHQRFYQIFFYETGEKQIQSIVNYNFSSVKFFFDEEGKLIMIRQYQTDLSDQVGEYPIISVKKAKTLLSQGSYCTSVPYEMPGEEYVEKVELVYRTGMYEQFYMPYYRFWVELPDMEREDGLKTYGAYYVPAVEAQYLTNMPTWDGKFN